MWLSLCILLFTASKAQTLSLTIDSSNFYEEFSFDTYDATHGWCKYQDESSAKSEGLVSTANDQIYLGVDMTSTLNSWSGGRDSVKVTSNTRWTYGLWIIQLEHMPYGCGTWPAYWLDGADWPTNGEIDIIEGVNVNDYDTSTLHTDDGCYMYSATGTSGISTTDCAYQPGCGFTNPSTLSYGEGFNNAGGGAYATLWNEDGISHWFWTKSDIPADVTSKTPDTSSWGTPYANFPFTSSCPSSHFNQLQIIINIELCSSDWGGGDDFSKEGCDNKGSCTSYISNPDNMKEAYWLIDSIDVYDVSGSSSSGSTSKPASSTSSTTACCQVQGSGTCMPQSTQWWCNESSTNCLGKCNDSGDKEWGVPGQPGTTSAPYTTPSPTSSSASSCCYVSGSSTCMPQSSQWWCNESSANCLGACNDSGDKVWGVPSAESANAMRQDTIEITADDWAVYGFAAIGLGFILYGAFRHFNGKTSEYTPVSEGQVA